MRIVIIGSGNVATVLGRKMILAKHSVVQVLSRSAANASALARELSTSYATNPAAMDATSDLYLLAIHDDSLYQVNEWLHLHDRLVVHTAGSVPMNVLKKVSRRYGVLYPLQSLRKELTAIPEIPFLVDGNDEDTRAALLSFAYTLSLESVIAGDEEREKLHLAAVIANNFTNHLYALAQDYCTSEKVDFNLLLPLISEMNRRVALGPAAAFQTGPAVRNDQSTMARQSIMLQHYPQLQQLYAAFSASILQKHAFR